MSWPVYSYALAVAPSVSAPQSVGGPEPGYVWVVRWVSMTYGTFIGIIPRGGLGLSVNGPWSFVCEGPPSTYVGLGKQSASAFTHYVVGDGQTLYVSTEGLDLIADFTIMGYKLTSAGA